MKSTYFLFLSLSTLFVVGGCNKGGDSAEIISEVTVNGKTYTPAVDMQLIRSYKIVDKNDTFFEGITYSFSFFTGDSAYNCILSQEDGKTQIRTGEYATGYSYIHIPLPSGYNTLSSITAKGFIYSYDQLNKRISLSYQATFADTTSSDTFTLDTKMINLRVKETSSLKHIKGFF